MNRLFKNWLYLLILFTSSTGYSLDTIITFFVQKYPYLKKKIQKTLDPETQAQYSKKLRQPDYVYRNIAEFHHSHHNQIPGIMCIYAGRVMLSTPQGQITFPRQQQTPDMYVLISQGIKPAYIVAPSTIHNWLLDPTHPAEMYKMTLKHDSVTTLYYYETTKVPLPTNQNIPLNTLIFIADPSTMYIPQGATIVDYSPNIILPTMYIKRGFCFVYNSLYTLAIKQYFEKPEVTLKQENNTISSIQQLK